MATRLTKLGFSQVYMLTGGLAQWKSDNQPVTRDKSPTRKKPKRDASRDAGDNND
jgi:3-mercaptopyruvate sulfurtransferase SseA